MREYGEKLIEFLKNNRDDIFRTHRELCLIPAPSHFEDERAKYCKELLESFGARGVYTDGAKNVVFPMNCEGSDRITVVNAHTDTVFPADTPLVYDDDGETVRCPGAGDDTASLTAMLYTAKFLIREDFRPDGGLLFVCNSCEEGLGNLLGIRRIYEDYAGRIARQISVDACIGEVYDRCVGSHRYEVTVTTAGGHSFGSFGKKNAIAEAAGIITRIYGLEVPVKEGTKTTYNVGTITGGTSVNTIAQKASFLCEYRSDDVSCMEIMKKAFEEIFEEVRTDKVGVAVNLVGDRPCADGADMEEISRLADLYCRISQEITGAAAERQSASTDCNIPLSLGIPAVCVGATKSGGAHTTREWLKKESLIDGTGLLVRFLSELL